MPAIQTIGMEKASEKKRMSRILVVEDSPTQAQELLFILASDELEVEIATNAERGLLLFQTSDFDLVITDIVLPGMSGYELCEQSKNNTTKGDVPVILLTSLSDPMNIIQGLECGANNFITKPYEANHLLGRVKTILDKKISRSNGKVKVGAEVVFLGKKLTINSDKEQILDLLISTFEDIVRTNQELQARRRNWHQPSVRSMITPGSLRAKFVLPRTNGIERKKPWWKVKGVFAAWSSSHRTPSSSAGRTRSPLRINPG